MTTFPNSIYACQWIIAIPAATTTVAYTHWPDWHANSSTRRGCIARWLEKNRDMWNDGVPEGSFTWRQWYQRGYRAVRVKAVLA